MYHSPIFSAYICNPYFYKPKGGMPIPNDYQKELLDYLTTILNDDNIDIEKAKNLLEVFMTRKKVESIYKDKIKQLNSDNPDISLDHRYYIYLNGKKKKFTRYEDLLDYLSAYESSKIINELTLSSIFEGWKMYRRISKSDGTFRKDMVNWETFISGSELARKPIDKIDIDDGILFFMHCRKIKPKMKEKYFCNIHSTVNSIMHYAMAKKIIRDNPIEKIEINKDYFEPVQRKKDSQTIYEDDERAAIKKLAFEKATATKEAKFFAPLLLLNLGMRDGELLALKWKDIDLHENTIHIYAQMTEYTDDNGKYIGFRYVDHPKTQAGNRTLYANSEVQKILRLIRQFNLEKGYGITDEDFVLQRTLNGEATFCTPRTMYGMIESMCKAIGMEVKSPHDMRRTFATNLFYANTPIKDIQALMGHEDARQTEAYIRRKKNENVAEFLEAII